MKKKVKKTSMRQVVTSKERPLYDRHLTLEAAPDVGEEAAP